MSRPAANLIELIRLRGQDHGALLEHLIIVLVHLILEESYRV